MAKHIFLSYKRQEGAFAQKLKEALESVPLPTWLDQELQGGQRWELKIDEMLLSARSVVVLWSTSSVTSDWVKSEASVAKSASKLVHARIDECDVPKAFHSVQWVELAGWDGTDVKDPRFLALVSAIKTQRSAWLLRRGSAILAAIAITAALSVYLVANACALGPLAHIARGCDPKYDLDHVFEMGRSIANAQAAAGQGASGVPTARTSLRGAASAAALTRVVPLETRQAIEREIIAPMPTVGSIEQLANTIHKDLPP